MSRAQFVDRVAEVVRDRFPLVRLGQARQDFAITVNGHVASLENLYRVTQLQPEQMQHHVERWMVELLRASEGHPDMAGDFKSVKQRILPMILAGGRAGTQSSPSVSQPLLEGLSVGYAVDNDRVISYIPQRLFESWEIPLDQLHELAIGNLVARSQELAANAAQDEDGRINLILFQTMDGYDASRILLPDLHARLREHLGSPFAAAVPNRDILLCFRNDAETVGRLENQIKQDYRQMPHQITDRLFLVTADGLAWR